MRTLDEIKTDPQATADELDYWSRKARGREVVAAHPNCPADLWWVLVKHLPLEATSSPSFALFTLEDPARWAETEGNYIWNWISTAYTNLTEKDRERWLCDCIAQAMIQYDLVVIKDMLALRWKRIDHAVSDAAWSRQRRLVEERINSLRDQNQHGVRSNQWHWYRGALFAGQASYSKGIDCATDAAQSIEEAYRASLEDPNQVETPRPVWIETRRWQWQRALQYLRGEA